MRNLFLSEKRCVANLMQGKWGVGLRSEPIVVKERFSEPVRKEKGPKFNCDFVLDFVEDFLEVRERDGTMNTALPNTLGADVYLFVERPSLHPLHLELMFGEAFSIKFYSQYIARTEAAIREAVLSQRLAAKLSQSALLQRLPVKKAACARVLVVGGDVCFLYFPSEAVPVMRGLRFDLAESDDRHIACYLDDEEIVCFDGWIKTDVTRSERVLVAQPE